MKPKKSTGNTQYDTLHDVIAHLLILCNYVDDTIAMERRAFKLTDIQVIQNHVRLCREIAKRIKS